jgi:hypothetical protein
MLVLYDIITSGIFVSGYISYADVFLILSAIKRNFLVQDIDLFHIPSFSKNL